MLSIAATFIVAVGIICILYWGYSKLEPMLPQSGPVKVFVIVVTVIFAIMLLLWLVSIIAPGLVKLP